MAPRSSKKTQAELISPVKQAGWKEDQETSKEWRWYLPSNPAIYYTLRDAADLVRLRTAGVAKGETSEFRHLKRTGFGEPAPGHRAPKPELWRWGGAEPGIELGDVPAVERELNTRWQRPDWRS